MSATTLVDAHMHVYPSRASSDRAMGYEIWEYGSAVDGVGADGLPGDLAGLRAAIEATGLAHAVVLNMPPTAGAPSVPGEDWSEEGGMVASNLGFLAATAGADRLVPFVGIDPLALNEAGIVAHVHDCAGRGARRVKLHPPVHGYPPDAPRLDPLYSACTELGLVVLAHSGPAKDPGHAAEPPAFAAVVERHPTLRLQLAHLGGASWSSTVAFAEAHPSVMWDLCELIEWVGTVNAPSPADMTRLIQGVGVERVLFGSDFPWYDPAVTVERVDALPGLGAGETEAVLGLNAVRLLGL